MSGFYVPDEVVVETEEEPCDCDQARTKRAWIVLGSHGLAAVAALFAAVAALLGSLPYLIKIANWIFGFFGIPEIGLHVPSLVGLLEQLLTVLHQH
jgi:hypothetical protein